MTYRASARTRTRRSRIRRRRAAALLAVVAATGAALGDQLPGPPSSSTSTAAAPPVVDRDQRPDPPRRRHGQAPGGLDPALLSALRRAAADASHDGVELEIVSGRRSPEHQRRLLEEAVSKYGSQEEAARWVATPESSPHVSGDAVDIGPARAAEWLSEHGARYGLCQIYGNEPWHFELRPQAAADGCPPMYPDPTHDPRMQQ